MTLWGRAHTLWTRFWMLWPRRAFRFEPPLVVATALVVATGVLVALSIFGVVNAPALCSSDQFSCGVLTNLLVVALVAAFGYGVLVYWRMRRVVHRYINEAQESPERLVETAARIDGVVGRDGLCEAIESDLREPGQRSWRGREYPPPRAQVLLGDVGAGKTAVLVRLTQILAKRGAVPVPLRLRDADKQLDFIDLARRRFFEIAGQWLDSDGDGDKIWRMLWKNGTVVILADGLDEALLAGGGAREAEIRRAVDRLQNSTRLIITSRPDFALVDIPAALVQLEPLSEKAALDHITDVNGAATVPKIRAVCAKADVVEMPFYLWLARELNQHNVLSRDVNARDAGRLSLRIQLLDRFVELLQNGRAESKARLTPEERGHAIAGLGVLACVALLKDTQKLQFDDFWERLPEISGSSYASRVSPELASTAGVQLNLTETLKGGVRFRHSPMQAYLASLLLPEILASGDDYLDAVLNRADSRPGRELLMALVMSCSRRSTETLTREESTNLRETVVNRLATYAETNPNELGLAARAAAYELENVEIQGGVGPPPVLPKAQKLPRQPKSSALRASAGRQSGVGRGASTGESRSVTAPVASESEIERAGTPEEAATNRRSDASKAAFAQTWPENPFGDSQLDEAKLRVIDRLAETPSTDPGREQDGHGHNAVKKAPSDRRPPRRSTAWEHYRRLWWIAELDARPQIRFYAARAVGAGGDAAFSAMPKEICEAAEGSADRRPDRSDPGGGARTEDALGSASERRSGVDEPDPPPDEAFPGDQGPTRAAGLEDDDQRGGGRQDAASEFRRSVLAANVLPLLAGTCRRYRERALEKLVQLQARTLADELEVGVEAALAQGFKFEANRVLPREATQQWEARNALFSLAEDMATARPRGGMHAICWYSRLLLLQALALWLRGYGPSVPAPQEHIWRWAAGDDHPFVREGARLSRQAVRTGEPSRFLWLDEAAVVSKLGPKFGTYETSDAESEWISPAAGWLGLAHDARVLVAEVVLLLNLAEGVDHRDPLANLDRTCGPLPACIAEPGRRQRLNVLRRIEDPNVGTLTNCVDACNRNLCPYPAQSERLSRGEFSEAFSRDQSRLAARGPRGRMRWQSKRQRELREFWKDMEKRAAGG